VKATVVGRVPQEVLKRAVAGIADPDAELRTSGGTCWVQLPADVSRAALDRIHAAVGGELVVIEVELGLGMRGSDAHGTRYVLPRGNREDLTEDVRETIHAWREDSPDGGFDEDVYATELAWEYIDADDNKAKLNPDAPVANLEDRWAMAAIAKLVEDGAIEVAGKMLPVPQLAARLASRVADDGDVPEDLGAWLLDLLVDSPAVEEVFADAETLVAALRATRPSR
jgi:hypothetical protein